MSTNWFRRFHRGQHQNYQLVLLIVNDNPTKFLGLFKVFWMIGVLSSSNECKCIHGHFKLQFCSIHYHYNINITCYHISHYFRMSQNDHLEQFRTPLVLNSTPKLPFSINSTNWFRRFQRGTTPKLPVSTLGY